MMQEAFSILPVRKDKSLIKDRVHCSVDEKEHSKRDKGAQVPWQKLRKPVC